MSTVDQIKGRVSAQLRDLGFRYAPRLHKAVIDVSGGKIGARFSGMPVVELHTTGRQSGLPRTTLLAAPLHDESRTVLVASKGGDDRHPEWFLNLQADPDVEVVVAGRTERMRARVATEEERAELWPQIVARYRGYAGYQKKTGRQIPVVICEPRPVG